MTKRYFMISIHTETGLEKNFEVYAETSGRALLRALNHIGAIDKEPLLDKELLLHSIHVGAPYEKPCVNWEEDEEDDEFERLG